MAAAYAPCGLGPGLGGRDPAAGGGGWRAGRGGRSGSRRGRRGARAAGLARDRPPRRRPAPGGRGPPCGCGRVGGGARAGRALRAGAGVVCLREGTGGRGAPGGAAGRTPGLRTVNLLREKVVSAEQDKSDGQTWPGLGLARGRVDRGRWGGQEGVPRLRLEGAALQDAARRTRFRNPAGFAFAGLEAELGCTVLIVERQMGARRVQSSVVGTLPSPRPGGETICFLSCLPFLDSPL